LTDTAFTVRYRINVAGIRKTPRSTANNRSVAHVGQW